MDCRFADSDDMNIVRKQIQKSSAILRSPETITHFDFAGQKEFYTSHCAILENAVQTSPPIIILCAKLVESEQAIIDSMYRWLTLVQNQCTNLKGKAHVIVVGSHADKVKEMEEDPRAKESIFAPIIKQFPKFEFTEFIPMDCRFADSDDMNIVRKQIQKSSAILRSPETITHFDFAGQKEFYTSHCAILENAVQTSPPIIILCAKLVESEQAIIDSMYRWLTLVQNQCTNLKGKAHVIVVGSHADKVKEMEEDPRAKESIFAPCYQAIPKV